MGKYILAFLLSASVAFFGALAMAAGGKNQWNNPIFSDGCIASLPPGIDLTTCTAVSGTGLITYYCEGEVITVTCPDDGPQAPGQSKAYLWSD